MNWNQKDIYGFDGEWIFFPHTWVTPDQVLGNKSNYPSDAKIGSGDLGYKALGQGSHQGKGSYLIKISGLPKDQVISMYNFRIYSSAQFYFFGADGQGAQTPVESLGINEELARIEPMFSQKPYLSLRTFGDQDHYLLIQTANYHHAWGGMWQTPLIGSQNAIGEAVRVNIVRDNIIVGLMLFVVIFNFAIFLRLREDLTSLALAISALVFTVRIYVFHDFSPDLWGDAETSFEINHKIIYIYWTMGTVSFLFFLHKAFPRQLSLRLFLGVLSSQIPLWLLIVFTTAVQYYDIVNPIVLLWTAVTPFFIFWILIKAYLHKEEGSLITISGYLVAIVSALNDTLWSLDLPHLYFPLLGMGYSIFYLSNSLVIAQRFANAFRNSRNLSRNLQAEVERQTRDIRSILDGIEQGIFSIFDRKAPIGPQYSQHLTTIVAKDHVEKMNIDQLLLKRTSLSSDEISRIHTCFDMSIHEDEINFEVNRHILPQELKYQSFDGVDKILNLDWNPVYDHNECVEKILVTIRDVTKFRALELESKKREEDIRVLIELINIPEDRFQRFVKKTYEYLQDSREMIQVNSSLKQDVIKRLFINMHTIKGGARTYLLKALSDASHEVEHYYSELVNGSRSWNQEALLAGIDQIEKVVKEYQDIGENKLGWQLSKRTAKIPVAVIEDIVTKIIDVIEGKLNDYQSKELFDCLLDLCEYGFVSLNSVFDEVCSGIDSMARDLGKEVPELKIESEAIILKDEGVNLLHSILVHIIRNTMDHGLEKPEKRKALGKNPRGTINLRVFVNSNHQLELLYRDDGSGLDLKRIEEIANRNKQDRHDFTEDELVNFIFQSGFTTKDQVSDISGRGVGLGSAKEYIEAKGGHIKVELLPENEKCTGRPFVICLMIPEGLWILSKEISSSQVAS